MKLLITATVSLLLIVFALACSDSPTAPIDFNRICDKEKQAVWASIRVGNDDKPVPAQLMSWGEWWGSESSWGLGEKVIYFLPLREGCKVMRVN